MEWKKNNAGPGFVLYPVCGRKTKTKIRTDTILENFPLFWPKCKNETLVAMVSCSLAVLWAGLEK